MCIWFGVGVMFGVGCGGGVMGVVVVGMVIGCDEVIVILVKMVFVFRMMKSIVSVESSYVIGCLWIVDIRLGLLFICLGYLFGLWVLCGWLFVVILRDSEV